MKEHPEFQVRALVRSKEHLAAVAKLGIHPVLGDHRDTDLIRQCCRSADIVLNAADSDDLRLTRAVLDGLEHHKRVHGSRAILIHTSGAGVVADNAEGVFTDYAKKIWNDASLDDIKSIPASQPHRDVDLTVFNADDSGFVSAYIIAPSCVYGVGTGPVNALSQQVPRLIRIATMRHQTMQIGPGTNIWNNVHIMDLVKLYLLVLKLALSQNDHSTAFEKFYFGSASEHTWGSIAGLIAGKLFSRGRVVDDRVKRVSLAQQPDLRSTASNSRSASNRGYNLGWMPQHPSIEATLDEDIDATLGNMN